jgi:hypothetical protein
MVMGLPSDVLSQQALAQNFVRGATTGQASNVSIQKIADGVTALVGYGHAVYAKRTQKRGTTAYGGWYGYSPSTSSALTKMGLSPVAYEDYDRDFVASALSEDKPTIRDVRREHA